MTHVTESIVEFLKKKKEWKKEKQKQNSKEYVKK